MISALTAGIPRKDKSTIKDDILDFLPMGLEENLKSERIHLIWQQ